VRAANDVLRFLLELGLLSAVAYWGWSEGNGWWRWLLVVVAPLAIAAAWGRLLAPKSQVRLTDPWRLVAEIALFGAGTAALVWAGRPAWAAVFGGLTALHLALTFVLGQRSPDRPNGVAAHGGADGLS